MDTRVFKWFRPPECNTLRPLELYCYVWRVLISLCELVLRLVQTCGLLVSACRLWWLPGPFIAEGRTVTQRPDAQHMALRWLDPIQGLGYYWLGVANDDGMENIPSYRTTILHTVSSMESSCLITTVASTRGGQQPMVAGDCNVAIGWHVTPGLLVDVASVMHMCPLPAL
jgi:hypothetical protein